MLFMVNDSTTSTETLLSNIMTGLAPGHRANSACTTSFQKSSRAPLALSIYRFLPVLALPYPSPSRYTCVSLHMGRTKPMVHWSLEKQSGEGWKDGYEWNGGSLMTLVALCLQTFIKCSSLVRHLTVCNRCDTYLNTLGRSLFPKINFERIQSKTEFAPIS